MFASKQMFYIFVLQVIAMQFVNARSSSGQPLEETKISIHVQSASLEKVLGAIEKETKYAFSYAPKTIQTKSKYTFDYSQVSIAQLLKQVAQKDRLTFRRINNNISIIRAKKKIRVTSNISGDNTTGRITGVVKDDKGESLPGATIQIIGLSTGSKYGSISNSSGRFEFPYLEVGEKYNVKINFVGFKEINISEVQVKLGKTTNLEVIMSEFEMEMDEVTVMASSKSSVNINAESLNQTPQVDRSINDFLRLSPLANTSDLAGFSGLRLLTSNISVDGSSLNNSFGLGGASALLAGNASNSEPISLDALEEVQVNVAPFDVRQGGFTGANINSVTRSGSNEFKGSVYYFHQNEKLVGKKVKKAEVDIVNFSKNTVGARLGGPIIKDKLFFFANYERNTGETPASNYVANTGKNTGENISRVLEEDIKSVRNFLKTNYNYEAGAYQGWSLKNISNKFLLKLNYNISEKHKASIRYNHLDAKSDQGPSIGGGSGSEFNNPNAMAFENSGWLRKIGVRSLVGELKSIFGSKFSNRIIASYTFLPESREVKGKLFPYVNIKKEGLTYISFGSDPFANNNVVNQRIIDIKNDFDVFIGNHNFTVGAEFQYMGFKNGFTRIWQGNFQYNSLNDFYNSTDKQTQTPIGESTGEARPFIYQRRFSGLKDGSIAYSTPKFSQLNLYFQDDYQVTENLKLLGGIRIGIPSYLNSPSKAPNVDTLKFQNPNGNLLTLDNSKLPKTTTMISPRFGFEWNLKGDGSLNIKGGTGVFTGFIPFSLISGAFLDNGINQGSLFGIMFGGRTKNYPFNPDPNAYIPTFKGLNTRGQDIMFVDENLKLPQVWKTNVGIEATLPFGLKGSLDVLYGRTLNELYAVSVNYDNKNANEEGKFFKYNSINLNNGAIRGAYQLRNTSKGHQLNVTAQLEKPFQNNWAVGLAYTYGVAKDISTLPGSNLFSAFSNLPVSGNRNLPEMAYSDADQKHRMISTLAYRLKLGDFGATTFSLFAEANQNRRFSYTYNGSTDGISFINGTNLIYVPNDKSDIQLVDYKDKEGNTITVDAQWEALNNFISNSEYLNTRKGKFVERNGQLSPWFFKMDFKLIQDFYLKIGEKKHNLRFTFDILNFTNLLNKDWGIRQIAINTTPINYNSRADNFTVNPSLLKKGYFTSDLSQLSRWKMQIGVRYSF